MAQAPKPPYSKPILGQSKIMWVWVSLFLAMGLLWSFSSREKKSTQLSIPELLQKVSQKEIVELTLKANPNGGNNWYRLSGYLKGEEPESFKAEGRLSDELYDTLVKARAPYKVIQKPATTFWTELVLSIMPLLLIIGLLYFLFSRQMRSVGKHTMGFGKSRARLTMREKEGTSFKDVAGCDESKEEVAEVIEFLKDPKRFQEIGGRVPKGILMVGPPGTGKTLLARAVAGEAKVPFFSISGSDFVEMFVGVGASRVRDMFEQGKKSAPCIIFIDEIDAVGRKRGTGVGGGNDEREQTLNSLLVEMDGFEDHEGIIIIAATNQPDVLDRALLRPGRFDRQVYLDLPDLRGRLEVLKVHAKKIKLDENVDLKKLATTTAGFSGADLANVLNEAALLAARFFHKQVSQNCMEEARDKVAFGRERKKLMDQEDKRLTAWHEAGHALAQILLKTKKIQLHKVTILPRGRALGMTMSTPTKDILGESKQELLDRICVLMAGRVGEELESKDFSNGAAGDIAQATQIARRMVWDWGMSDLGPVALTRDPHYATGEATVEAADQAVRNLITKQYKRATELIKAHHEALNKVAEALLKYETIEGIHVTEIMETGHIQSPVKTSIDDIKNNQTESEKKTPTLEENLKTPDNNPTKTPDNNPTATASQTATRNTH